jgi:hypothetical protein
VGLLLAFLPEEALPLVLIFGAFAVMLGLISARGLLGYIIGFIVIGLVAQSLWPVFGQVFGSLSLWLQLVILIVGGVLLLRILLSLVFGAGVANHVVSLIVYDVFFRLPTRMLGAAVAAIFGLTQAIRDRW